MTMSSPACVGMRIENLATPCALVDAQMLDCNLRRMADYFSMRRCKLRPHFKSHKCVAIARRQIAAGGTAGITCAKLSEAEALADGGIDNILIANQVVGPDKARWLAALCRRATVRVCVDSENNARELGTAACREGIAIGCLVEVDIGNGRCGVPPGTAAVALARRIAATKGLRFDGLQGYEGGTVCFVIDPAERRRAAEEFFGRLVKTKKMITAAGLPVAIVSCSRTW